MSQCESLPPGLDRGCRKGQAEPFSSRLIFDDDLDHSRIRLGHLREHLGKLLPAHGGKFLAVQTAAALIFGNP